MELLWADSRLIRLPKALRGKIRFYAPLLDSLYFFGVDPVTFTRASTSTATWRDGIAHDVAVNQPRFEYDSEMPLGLALASGEMLQFSAQNALHDAATLIWFEDGMPMSTPTDGNPFDNTGAWTGNLDVHLKHVVKAKQALAASEIAAIQELLGDVAQAIPPTPGPVAGIGTFVFETPTHAGGGVYTLSNDPDLDSLLIFAHGGLCLNRVVSSPGNLEFTAGGSGNRTITPGLAPSPVGDIWAQYVVAS